MSCAWPTGPDSELQPVAKQDRTVFVLGSCVEERQSSGDGSDSFLTFQFRGLGESVSGALSVSRIQVRGTDPSMATSTARLGTSRLKIILRLLLRDELSTARSGDTHAYLLLGQVTDITHSCTCVRAGEHVRNEEV